MNILYNKKYLKMNIKKKTSSKIKIYKYEKEKLQFTSKLFSKIFKRFAFHAPYYTKHAFFMRIKNYLTERYSLQKALLHYLYSENMSEKYQNS